MANIIIGPNNNTGLYTGLTGNTSISGGGGTGNYSNANVAAYLQVLTSNISTTGNVFANQFRGNSVSVSGNVRANIFLQASDVVRLGTVGGINSTSANTISLGINSGAFGQQDSAVAIGAFSGNNAQGANSVAIGRAAGYDNQGEKSVALGFSAGYDNQAGNAIAIGLSAGFNNQGLDGLAIGRASGNLNQGESAIAIGVASGLTSQGANAVAIGRGSGNVSQGVYAVALGFNAGRSGQGANAIAIGFDAGNTSQGANSIAIGKLSGFTGQTANSIVINASGNILNATRQGLYINPVRNDNANVAQVVFFNTGTKELTYASQTAITANYSNANVQAFLPDFVGTLGNVVDIFVEDVYATGNVEADFFVGDGSYLSNINGANIINGYGNTEVAAFLPTYTGNLSPNTISASGNVTTGNILIAGDGTVIGNFNVLGNLTYTGVNTITTSNLFINLANNQTTYANINNAGIVVGDPGNALTQFQYSVASNTWVTNVGVSALGNIHGANIFANGSISATGNLTIGTISSTGNLTTTNVSASGNVQAGNLSTAGNVSATGTIAANVLLNFSNIVRLGQNAGNATSNANVIAIGRNTAQIGQEDGGIAIGFQAGNNNQGGNSIAIGRNAGAGSLGAQSANAIAIGRSAGNNSQGTLAIALGQGAGNNNQGNSAIAIGRGAGFEDQPANSIIITAGGNLTGNNSGFYVNPVRNDVSSIGNVVFFDTNTFELTYADAGLLGGNYSNSNVSSFLADFGSNVISSTGTIETTGNVIAANVFLTNGSQIYSTTNNNLNLGANAGVGNASSSGIGIDNLNGIAIFANTSVVLTSNSQGTFKDLTFDTSGDLLAPGNISTAGNVIAGFLYGDGSNITGIAGSYDNANVATFLADFGSNSISTSGNITVGNAIASYLYGDGSNITGIAGSYDNANVATFLADFGSNSISTSGNITSKTGTYTNGDGANFDVGNTQITLYFQSGTEYPQWIVSRHNAGIAANNAIDFFTSNGNASAVYPANAVLGLSVNNGNVGIANTPNPGNALDVGGNVYAAGNISALGNISAAYLYGNGSNITGLPASYDNANVATFLADFGSNSISTSGNITVGNVIGSYLYGDGSNITGLTNTGNVTFANINVIGTGNLHLQPDPSNVAAYLDVYLTTYDIHIGSNFNNIILGTDNGSNVTVNTDGNVSIQANTGTAQIYTFGSDGLFTAPGNINAGNISITANIDAGNISSGGFVNALDVNATGNITGAYLYGDGSNITGIVSSYDNANVSTFLADFGSNVISTTGNINAGNILLGDFVGAGNITATGNITAAYLYGDGSNITGLPASYSNSNVATFLADFGSNVISTSGNITGNVFLGNGSQLTGIVSTYGDANVAAFLPTYTGNIGNTGNSVSVQFVNYKDVVVTAGNATGTITPDASQGSIYKYTLTGNITLNAMGGTPQAGQSMVVVLTQDATGNRLLTSTMKWAGGFKTLSTAANAIDIATIWYDGSTYYGALTRGYA